MLYFSELSKKWKVPNDTAKNCYNLTINLSLEDNSTSIFVKLKKSEQVDLMLEKFLATSYKLNDYCVNYCNYLQMPNFSINKIDVTIPILYHNLLDQITQLIELSKEHIVTDDLMKFRHTLDKLDNCVLRYDLTWFDSNYNSYRVETDCEFTDDFRYMQPIE